MTTAASDDTRGYFAAITEQQAQDPVRRESAHPILSAQRETRGAATQRPAACIVSVLRMNAKPSSGSSLPVQHIAIAYFSHSGNTRAIAHLLAGATGGALFEITPTQAYPEDYETVVAQAKRELRSGYLPPLTSSGPAPQGRPLIFLGSPNWWNTMAPPMMSYLKSHDFSGCLLVPYITHEGSGLGSSVADIQRLCPDATVFGARAFRGTSCSGAAESVRSWLSALDTEITRRLADTKQA